MLIQAVAIFKMPVGAIETQNKIGEVHQIVFDPKNGEIIGFEILLPGLITKKRILSMKDVLDFDRNGIVIKSEENLLDKKEIVKIDNIIREGIQPFKSKAFTKSGKKIGKIFDLVIDTNSLLIIKYYIHGLFTDKIIDSDKVIKIEKGKVIFEDQVLDKIASPKAEKAAA